MDNEKASAILIKTLRGLAINYHGGIRHGFWIKIDKYIFLYRPFWNDSEYVPSELATYKVYLFRRPTKRWFNRLLGQIKYDDGQYMGIQIWQQADMDIKDCQGFINAVMCLEGSVKWESESWSSILNT